MDDSRLLRTMRYMEWEKIKGQLSSMLHTYWGDEKKFEEASKHVNRFIKRIDDYGIFD